MAEESFPQDIINRCLLAAEVIINRCLPVSEERVPQDIIDRCLRAGQEGNIATLYELIGDHPHVLEQIDNTPFAETPLHAAASAGNTAFALEIMTLKPSLSRKLNRYGLTPLHLVLSKLLTPENPALQQTPPCPNLQIQLDPNLDLQQIQLHSNCALPLPQSNGHQHPQPPLNQETLLVPKPALELAQTNTDQEIPSDQNHKQAQPDTDQQPQPEPNPSQEKLYNFVLRFLQFDKDLARVKGQGGLTPLHYAAQIGHLQLLKEILTTCPMSILDVTVENETALHVALKKNQPKAYILLKEWLRNASFEDASLWREKLENWKDADNKTFFDLASEHEKAITQIQVNHHGIRFLDPLYIAYEPIYKNFARVREESRSAVAVVFVLLVTLTFQITITPPGGTWSDNGPSHRAGAAIMGPGPFIALTVVNSFSVLYSLTALAFLLPHSRISGICIVPLSCFVAYVLISICVTYPSPKPLSLKAFYAVFLVSFFYALASVCIPWKAKAFRRW